jgi:hypothetical protein
LRDRWHSLSACSSLPVLCSAWCRPEASSRSTRTRPAINATRRSPSIVTGAFVVTWINAGDGSGDGVFARSFDSTGAAANLAIFDVDGNGSTEALTDALLILRYVFGFRGATLTAGAVGGSCSRCDAAAIEPYLAPLVI